MTATSIEQTTLNIASALADEPGPLLPILHAVQAHFGYIPPESVPPLAQSLNLSRADIHGVVSFYDWFHSEAVGNKTVYICRAEACQSMGSTAVEIAARAHLGIDFHQSSADGSIHLQPVYCLGNCACSPSVMVEDKLYSRVTPEGITALLDDISEGKV